MMTWMAIVAACINSFRPSVNPDDPSTWIDGVYPNYDWKPWNLKQSAQAIGLGLACDLGMLAIGQGMTFLSNLV